MRDVDAVVYHCSVSREKCAYRGVMCFAFVLFLFSFYFPFIFFLFFCIHPTFSVACSLCSEICLCFRSLFVFLFLFMLSYFLLSHLFLFLVLLFLYIIIILVSCFYCFVFFLNMFSAFFNVCILFRFYVFV